MRHHTYRRLLRLGAASALSLMVVSVQAKSQALTSRAAPIRGVVRALNSAAIGIDLAVKVAKIHFREAEAFKKGDALVTFDCKRIEAEHAAAVAASRETKLALQSQSYLEARGAVGKLDVEISRARSEKSEAEAASIAARLEQCVIVAPFDGRVTELKINENEVAPVGQPFISLVDETKFEIDLILPSQALRSLKPGVEFQFRIDETDAVYSSTISRIGAVVDPISQSIKAIAAFVAPDRGIVAGMSGTALIPSLEESR